MVFYLISQVMMQNKRHKSVCVCVWKVSRSGEWGNRCSVSFMRRDPRSRHCFPSSNNHLLRRERMTGSR